MPTVRLNSIFAAGLAGTFIAFAGAAPSRAATPETVTLGPSDTEVTWQTPTLAGSAAESRGNCVEDVTCDTLVVTILPGDYTGRRLRVGITWTVPADDIDLFMFADRLDGPVVLTSNGGAPQTSETGYLSLGGVVTSARRYVVQVVGNECPVPQTVDGTLSLVPEAAQRTATFVPSDVAFSANVTVSAPFAARVCEPSLRVDVRGNCYVGGIRGVPAGVDLWRFDLDPESPTFDPEMRNPLYLGQPDAFAANDTTGGRDGGGDIDIATSFPSASQTPIVTVTSLALANVSSAVSTDRGANFSLSPAIANVPADDRQWSEAQGADTVYCVYRAPIPATGLFVQRSTDHGATYPVTGLASPTGTTPGYIDVDHRNGWVYVSHVSTDAVFVSRSQDAGLTWQTFTVDNGMSHGNLFDPVKVGDDGTVYVAWSDGVSIWLASSHDAAATWSTPVKVNGPETTIGLFPWIEAGSAGRVAVVWYGTTSSDNSDAADWRCWMGFVTDADGANPTVKISQVSDHVIHASNISLGGLAIPVVQVEANRNLCDYFQVAIDPQGACVVAFTDDHADFDGQTYVARQLSGPSLYASSNGGTGTLPAFTPTALSPPDPNLPEVSDFLHDAAASLQPIPGDSPYDIVSIDYDCRPNLGASQLAVWMKVSTLANVPPNSFWRANFTANAPGGTPDRGDMFYLRADTGTNSNTVPAFTFGTVLRDTSGAFVYTQRGTADGVIDGADGLVKMYLPLASLDPWVTHGPLVRAGSQLVGLMGQTGTLNEATARDLTRGGAPYTVCGTVGVEDTPLPRATFELGMPRPTPTHGAIRFTTRLSSAAWSDVAVFDLAGRRVRTIAAGVLPAGTSSLGWDGRNDGGAPVAAGVYSLRLAAGGEVRSQRVVMIR